MSTPFNPAPQVILDLARELIDLYHADLANANIGFLVRDEAQESGGRIILGKSKKTPDDMRAYVPFDFIIWIAGDWWPQMRPNQQRALLDHELSHCHLSPLGKRSMVPHDMEEFNHIIRRYGFWQPAGAGYATQEAVQARLEYAPTGRVGAVRADVLDQVGDLLDKQTDGADPGGDGEAHQI